MDDRVTRLQQIPLRGLHYFGQAQLVCAVLLERTRQFVADGRERPQRLVALELCQSSFRPRLRLGHRHHFTAGIGIRGPRLPISDWPVQIEVEGCLIAVPGTSFRTDSKS